MPNIARYRKVRFSSPMDHNKAGLKVKQAKILIPKMGPDQPVYQTVELFKKNYLQSIKAKQTIITPRLDLADLITLHNDDGIKDLRQVVNMCQCILDKTHILEGSGVPNVKAVHSKEKQLVLFDGHHTALAYLLAGFRYLESIPHIVVSNENDAVTDNEMADFFGPHRDYVLANGWQGFTVNWQAPFEKQVRQRRQKTVGEVFRALENRLRKTEKDNSA